MPFLELGLSPELVRAVTEAGYSTPTPIQAQAIPSVLSGRDVLGCAQTGTGKTASFTLPMIDILAQGRSRARMPRSLILEPTRELAAQVADSFEKYGRFHRLTKALLIGGVSMNNQERALARGVDVLIATPGRLLDHVEKGHVLLNDVQILVIDEADRMLDMGFIPDVERIAKRITRAGRQTLLFSATMPPEIRRLADNFLNNPKEVTVSRPSTTAETVTQRLVIVEQGNKDEALRRLLKTEEITSAIIFCNRKSNIAKVQRALAQANFHSGTLHGGMSQSQRMATLAKFKSGALTLLVASDVAARGLDINDLSHVFNFDVPVSAEDYVHRIGRTGRAGKDGKSFTFVKPDEAREVAEIEKLIGKPIEKFILSGMVQAELLPSDGRRKKGQPRGKSASSSPRQPREPRPPREARERSEPRQPREARPPRETRAPREANPNPNRERNRRPAVAATPVEGGETVTRTPRPPRERSELSQPRERSELRQPRERSEPRPPRERSELRQPRPPAEGERQARPQNGASPSAAAKPRSRSGGDKPGGFPPSRAGRSRRRPRPDA
ncbi:MAG: DEAD/DEAH box helicase [Candidatus Pacebacteria bacterium]|nr:DEAD/DEAH box helicase [Candidatus Paceibacterota bacterium]